MNKNIGFLAFGVALLALVGVAAATPAYINGATNSSGWTANEMTADVAGATLNVTAGYIYTNTLTGNSTTEYWAGLVGNVTGVILLSENASGTNYNLFSWVFNGNGGFVYATNATSVPTWSSLTTPTATNLNTFLAYGSDDDNATMTFNGTATADAEIAQKTFTAANIVTAHTYPVASDFETQLYNTSATAYVYAGNLKNDATSYTGGAADFQILVPDNERGSVMGTTYYFYLELH